MEFLENELYHIYNRGNNKQQIFFSAANYLYFLEKVRKFILPCCDILNYCLMPNHFHFLIHSHSKTVQLKKVGVTQMSLLADGLRNLLHSYAKGINKQNETTGSLFQQNTKSKCISDGDRSYGQTSFFYNHLNPVRAGLVKKIEEWRFSSFRDYVGLRNGTLCNKALAFELLDLDPTTFYLDSYQELNEEILKRIFE